MTHDGGSDDRPAGDSRSGTDDAPSWSRLLAGEATALPVDLGAAVGADDLADLLRRDSGVRLCRETDGSEWLAADLDAGDGATACVVANFLWSLVYQHGAPAVLLLEITSLGAVTVKVHQPPGESLTVGALVLLVGSRRLARRFAPAAEAAAAAPEAAAAPAEGATEAARPLRPETLARALSVLAGWQLCPVDDADALAAVFSFDSFFGPWVLWNLAAPALLATWPDVSWMVELGPSWVAFALRPAAGGPPTRRLVEAAHTVDQLAAGLLRGDGGEG